MTEQQREKILEAACEICRWPGETRDPETLWEYCETCPVEAALDAATEKEQPHGRLIDADALTAKFKEMGLGEHSLIERLFADGVYVMIDYAPTIIPAEGGDAE